MNGCDIIYKKYDMILRTIIISLLNFNYNYYKYSRNIKLQNITLLHICCSFFNDYETTVMYIKCKFFTRSNMKIQSKPE